MTAPDTPNTGNHHDSKFDGITILRAAQDYKTMPWKNGLGETVEIAVFPDGATLEDFDWRLSMATVASDGPFSAFGGIERSLSILSGHGMTLMIEGMEPARLTSESEPLKFGADIPTNATLIDGTIVDFNVMTRRSRCAHHVRRIRGQKTAIANSTRHDRGIVVVLCHGGDADIAIRTPDGQTATPVRLGHRDCAIIGPQHGIDLMLVGETTDMFVIEINPA